MQFEPLGFAFSGMGNLGIQMMRGILHQEDFPVRMTVMHVISLKNLNS